MTRSMPLRRLSLLAGLLTASAAGAQPSPKALVDRAIAATGGRPTLTRFRAFEWDGRATVHAGGQDIAIAGTWWVAPPDTAVLATYEVARGPGSTRRVSLQGSEGWIERDSLRVPMAAATVVEERHQFYLYSLLRLVPLEDAEVTLVAIEADTAGRPGIRVERPGRLPVSVYFAPSGRVARMVTRFATLSGAGGDSQEVEFAGSIFVAGVTWSRTMRIRRNGIPYFDLELTRLARRDP